MCAVCKLAGKASGGLDCQDVVGQDSGTHSSNDPNPAPPAQDQGPVAAPAASPDIIETSDAANNAGTAYSIGIGQSAQGRIASLGDSDWFRVNLVAGHTYTFAAAGEGATSNSLDNPYLRLRDSAGTQLAFDNDSGPSGYSSLTFTASATGTYFLDVQAFNNASTGWYGLSAIEGTRATYDVEMGAGALLVPNLSWSATPGTGATVTWGFRQSAASYTTPGSNTQATFSQLSAAEMAAVQTVMQLWADISGVQFQQVNPGGYTNNATILFANYNDPNDGAGAFAYYPGSTGATSAAGDVFLNLSSVSTTSLPFGSYSFFTIMHEVGHTLGLAHPGDYNAAPGQSITYANNAQFTQDSQQYTVMSYFDEGYTGAQFHGYAESPMLFDAYALQKLYGANMATRAGDTVYGFNSNAGSVFSFSGNPHPAFTIWDGGGTDTIDASGYAQAQTINLNPGTYSTVGGETSNIAIAFGAVIENATGGSGNDTLIGNAANNVFTGNGGNDAISGGTGTDTAVYAGQYAEYAVSYSVAAAAFTIADHRTGTPDGTDSLTSVEVFQFADLAVINSFDGAGRLAAQTINDTADAWAWASQVWSYDPAGRLVLEATYNDNGTHWTNTYDAAAGLNWASFTQFFDPNGVVTTQVGTYDNDTHWLTLWDVANNYAWAQATISFDSDWAMTGVTGQRDDGTAVTMADIAEAYDTSLWYPGPYQPTWNGHHDLLIT